MATETVEILVEGGKATAGAQMGAALGPLGVNIANILQEINKKTEDFKGMKVPVKVIVEKTTKKFELKIGTPPTAELIKKELNLTKASGEPNKNKVGNLAIEQVIKIAKMKRDSMFINNLKSAVKSVIGTCNSLGILIEGKSAKEIYTEIDTGMYDDSIKKEKIDVSQEKIQNLQTQLKNVQLRLQKEQEKLAAFEAAEKATTKAIATKEAKAEAEEAKEGKPKEEKKEIKGKTEKPKEEKTVKEEKKK